MLPAHAEICDECAGTDLAPFRGACLESTIGDRPVGFVLDPATSNVVGRAADGAAPPTVDLSRFPASGSVHRRHADVREAAGHWRVTHAGTNPLIVQRGQEKAAIAPGASAELRSGDLLIVGTVPLRVRIS